MIISFQTSRYWPFLYKHWTYDLILGNVGILALFLYRLEFLFYPCKSWYSSPISISIVILMLLFQTMEFWPQFYKDWNTCNDLILPNIRILALFLYTLEFWPNIEFWHSSYKHLGILILSFYCNHWNCGPILPHILILALSLYTMEFLSYPSKHWNSGPSFIHNKFLILSFKTLRFWPYFSKHWYYDLILANIGFLALFLYA